LPNFHCITRNTHSRKGIAISIDALLALILLVALISFIGIQPIQSGSLTQPKVALNQLFDDAITVLDSTGFLMRSVEQSADANAFKQAVQNKLDNLLPSTIGYRLEMSEYRSDINTGCREQKTVEKCFPEGAHALLFSDANIPMDRDVFHGRKIFLKKEPMGCELQLVGELQEKKEPAKFNMFLEGESTVEFDFNATIESPLGTPTTEIECDETGTVKLSVKRKAPGREPVNVIFGCGKNKSMGECAIAKGDKFFEFTASSTSSGFQKVAEFSVPAKRAIDVLMDWSAGCAGSCPDFFIRNAAIDKNYGASQTTTQQNVTTCNQDNKAVQSSLAYYYNNKARTRYLGIGSQLGETGTWELYVKNPAGTEYNVEAKNIDNNHFDEAAAGLIATWDEPIAKVSICKAMVVDFTLRAEWSNTGADANKDYYAYAEVGLASTNPNTGSTIQPASGLRVAKDISPPYTSQLKNLDASTQSIATVSYSYALDKDDVINDTLVSKYASSHLKYGIIYGDSLDTPSAYTIATAIADAIAKDIQYYTIDFNESNKWSSVCQNTDLRALAEQTGGRCYAAYNENNLIDVLNLIAQEVVNDAALGTKPDPGSITITMSIPEDFDASFLSNFSPAPTVWDGETLEYQNITIRVIPWVAQFDLKIPCDFANCDQFFTPDKNFLVPPEDALLTYNIGGVPQPAIDWNGNTRIFLRYADIVFNFIKGTIFDANDVAIDYSIDNIGYLPVNLTQIRPTISYYQSEDPLSACSGELMRSVDFDGVLCPGLPAGDPACYSALDSVNLTKTGYFCAWVNQNFNVRECQANNRKKIYCKIPKTLVYVLDYWSWEK